MVDKLEAGDHVRDVPKLVLIAACPFCGYAGQWEGKGAWRVVCSNVTCGASGPSATYANEALIGWNHREPPTPTEDARSRVKVLEKALEAIRDGDVPRPVHCHWRADGKPSKLDECKHGVTMSEDCAGCTAEFIDTALGNKETDRHG